MVSLIDTNVIIRFLAADIEEQHLMSVDMMRQIQSGKLKVEILGEVLIVDFTQSFHPFHKHVSTFFTDETDCCNCTITGNITFDF